MSEITTIDIPPLEIIRSLKRDHFGYLQTLIQTYGPIFSFPFKPNVAIVIMVPAIIHHILCENKDNYIKGSDVKGTVFNYFKAVLGQNILLTDDMNLWNKHRKIIMPSLQRSHYETY